MPTAQIVLTEAESQALEALSKSKGKKTEELLHEAIEYVLEQVEHEKRLAALRHARGIWKGRKDLPSLRKLRREWDRD